VLRVLLSDVAYAPGSAAIFIDRDGVINRRRPDDYILDWSQFVFVPGIRSALKDLSGLGLPIIIVSNQSAVGRGLLQPAALEKITFQLHRTLLEDGTKLSAAYYCPHAPEQDCPCRKPKPGLLLQAALDFRLDLDRSVFIGDADTDLQAAHAAGCKAVLFGAGLLNSSDSLPLVRTTPAANSVEELFNVVVKRLR
jgi:D-glycero-D-manno-heptose 1,7-bisphosphate phosphatase